MHRPNPPQTRKEKPPCILIIEDNEGLRETLTRSLEAAGYAAKAVEHGNEAAKLLERERFDLILTDMFMPEKDGFQVIREVHKANPDLPIVAMSGGHIVQKGEHLKVAKFFGAKRVLKKPFSEKQLFSTIKSLIG